MGMAGGEHQIVDAEFPHSCWQVALVEPDQIEGDQRCPAATIIEDQNPRVQRIVRCL